MTRGTDGSTFVSTVDKRTAEKTIIAEARYTFDRVGEADGPWFAEVWSEIRLEYPESIAALGEVAAIELFASKLRELADDAAQR